MEIKKQYSFLIENIIFYVENSEKATTKLLE